MIGVAFVVASLVYTAIAARAAQEAASIAERALIADKRAFIFAETVMPFFEPGSKRGEFHWRFRPNWKNSGDTPSRSLRVHVDGDLRSTPLPMGFNFDAARVPPGTGLLGPQSSSMGGAWPYPGMTPITAADIDDLMAGRKYLYLWGWVRYRDVFPDSEEHITRFCWQLLPIGDPRKYRPDNQVLRWSNLHHAEGNCADQECRV